MYPITAIHTHEAGQMGTVTYGIHGMVNCFGEPRIAIWLRSEDLTALSVSFHGSMDDARAFAAALILHADATDAKKAELDAEAVS